MLRAKTQKKITLIDIAKDAGVSTATASLVVRRSPLVSEKTRDKVLESVKRLGYVHNTMAANLRSQESSTVGVIISDIANPFMSEILVGLHLALNEIGYDVLLGTTFDSLEKQEKLIESMLGHRICGLILSPVGKTSPSNIAVLEHSNVPVVLIGRDLACPNNFDYVVADSCEGARLATQHLIDIGHQRIAFLGGTEDVAVYARRFAGYRAALESNRIAFDPALVIQRLATFEDGEHIVSRVLEQSSPPTAAFCYNDIFAIGAILGLKKKGLLAGRDFGLVGFDDIKQSSITNPTLTTISIDLEKWGRVAAQLLDKRVKGKDSSPPKQVFFPATLVVRESSPLLSA
jgi:LacI family transcriptional regulator